MVKVIYNLFSRTPRSDITGQHWLQTVIDGFRNISKTESTIRVDADKFTNWSAYKVRNTTNKRKAICYNKEGFIYVEIYELPLPDVSQHLKPNFKDFSVHGKFVHNESGMKEASKFLANNLEVENAYFRNEQGRIKLTPNAMFTKESEVFLGGLLVDYDYDPTVNETVVTLVDPSKQYSNPERFTYTLKGMLRAMDAEKSLVGKYILINKVDDYLYMTKPIISMYYQFI